MTMGVDDDVLRAHVAEGGLVEHMDEMSPGYRRELVKMLRIAGDTELRSVPMILGYFGVGVPYRHVRPILAVAQDEAGHAHIDYRLLEDLGEDVDALLYHRPPNAWASPYLFDVPIRSWPEIAVVEGLGEYAGGLLVRNVYCHTSYGPWRSALVKVDLEERFHVKFGQSLMRELALLDHTRETLQRAVDWLFPLVLELLGPPGRAVDAQLEYRLKGKRVDDLRADLLAYAVPFCQELGVSVPAHLDATSGRYVLDVPFPCAFDPENRRWDFDQPVEWPEILQRWKRGGPCAERNVEWLQRGRRQMASFSATAAT
jgi:ring-1,2-phenylacetyl-CoA epoxidase subunit PaaA